MDPCTGIVGEVARLIVPIVVFAGAVGTAQCVSSARAAGVSPSGLDRHEGALGFLESNGQEAQPRVRLVSDSKYVLCGMTEWITGWIANDWRRGKKKNAEPVKNVDLWKELYELCGRYEMTYEHVKGHSGHPENEECDRLAVAEVAANR